MVTTLSKLVDTIQRGAIPTWIAEAFNNQKDEIARELQETGSFVLRGPNGEEVTIRAEKQQAAA